MTTEIDIVLGLGILSALFSYFAFEFLQHQEGEEESRNRVYNWNRNLGILCFLLSIIFINMLMYTLVLIAQNTGLSYLNDTVLVVGMQVLMWATLSGIALYLFALTLYSLRFITEASTRWWRGRGKEVVR